jgi:hypothetical protein
MNRPLPSTTIKSTGGERAAHTERLDALPFGGELRGIPGLDPPEQAIYDDLVNCMPEGLLGELDTTAVRMMLDQHKIYRLAVEIYGDNPRNFQMRSAVNGAFDRFLKLANELGLTPTARAGMKRPGTMKDDDPFMAIIARLAK